MWEFDESKIDMKLSLQKSNIDGIQNDLESDKSIGNNIPVGR